MKVAIIFFVTILFLTCSLFSQENSDEKAIIDLIHQSFQASLDRDVEKYLDTWAHEETAVRMYVTKIGYHEVIGWDSLKVFYERRFKNNPEPSDAVFEYKNFIIKVKDDMAWASFEKFVKNEAGEMEKDTTREFRRLVKKDGKWKILSLFFTYIAPPED